MSCQRGRRVGATDGRRHKVGARRSGAGFTLVELMIAMVAGLMVAMAVMGVSKEATNTFHEEVRVAGAEMALRVAMERLRQDLQRAAFMSTGNIVGDPVIARRAQATAAGSVGNLSNVSNPPAAMLQLSGIALHPGGSSVAADSTSLSVPGGTTVMVKDQLTNNGLSPDSIDIGGNFSSSDEYVAAVLWTASLCAAGPEISLQMNTPAAWRIRNATDPVAALQAAFHPGGNPNSKFFLRLTDPSGRYQYLVGAAGTAATVYSAGTTPSASVCLDASSTILKASDTGGLGGVAGFGAGWVVVNPVEIVRWDIQNLASVSTALSTAGVTGPSYTYGATSADASDFVLTRSYVDTTTTTTTTGGTTTSTTTSGTDPWTTEVVADYAVDLKFGLTIDTWNDGKTCTVFPCPVTAAPYGTVQPLVSVAMGSTTNSSYFSQSTTTYVPTVGPQRIRNVQARIAIRSQFADRVVSLAVPATSSTGYLYRYQIPTTPVAGAMAYARVRENTTDVSLPNQARFYW